MKMNKYVKEFILRGLLFMGFGPIIIGFIYWISNQNNVDLNLTGYQIFISIITISILAFVQAGSTIFHQIEHWSPMKAAIIQLLCIYIVYIATYLINSWIIFKWEVLLIFTIAIVGGYLLILIIIRIVTKSILKKLNQNL